MLCIPDDTTNTWIGQSWIDYSDLPNKDGTYKWTNGCSSTYVKNYFFNLLNLLNCAWIGPDGSWAGTTDSMTLPCTYQYYPGPSMSPTVLLTSPTVFPSAPPTVAPTVGCQPGWVYYNNKCYYFSFGNSYSWSECKSECTSRGASMLCIPDDATNSWIANFQLNRNSFSWIGYSDLPNKDRNFKWVSGCSSTYVNNGFTYSSDKIDCIYMSSFGGFWSSSYDSGGYLVKCSCEYQIHSGPSFLPTISPTAPTANPSTIVTTVSCMSGWIEYNNKCYNFNIDNDYYTWSRCKSRCTSIGTSMLCITDGKTNNWISNRLTSGFYLSWIGYSNVARGIYEWVPGCTSSFTDGFFYMAYDDFAIASPFGWFGSDGIYSYARCSCEYSLGPSSLPTLSPTSPTVYPSLLPTFISSMVPSVKPTITSTAACPPGWKDYNNKCYYFNAGFSFSWLGCKTKCDSLGASMLCIPDSTTNTWIANQLLELGSSNSWIGYSDLPNGYGNYKWVSGCSSLYSSSYFNNYYNCAYINSYGYWYSFIDSGSTSIMCSCEYNNYTPIAPSSLPTLSLTSPTIRPSILPSNKPTISASSPTVYPSVVPSTSSSSSVPSNISCLSGWSNYNKNCYNFNIGTSHSWSACLSQCTSLDTSMLCIPDSSTNSWISNQLLEFGYSYSWIGYSDHPNKDGNYKWVSGCSSSYTYWDVNTNYNNYDCAYIASDGFWGSTSDVGSTRTICICEYNPEPTSLPTIVPSALTASSSTISPTYNQNTSSSTTTTSSSTLSSATSSSVSIGAIIGIVLGCIFLITVTLGGSFVLWTRMHDAKVAIDDSKYNDKSSNQESHDFSPSYPDEEHPRTVFVELPIAEANNFHYYTDDVLPILNAGVIENI